MQCREKCCYRVEVGLSEAPNIALGAVGENFYCCSKKLNLGHYQELLKTPLWAKIPFLRLTQKEVCHFVMQD